MRAGLGPQESTPGSSMTWRGMVRTVENILIPLDGRNLMPGDSTTCMGMSTNGAGIGTVATCRGEMIQSVPLWARSV